jgi:hypothetical protein
MLLDPLARLGQGCGAEPALAGAADLLGGHEICALEDQDVLLDPVERQAERLRQLADGRRPSPQAIEDPAPRRIGEREERAVERQR